jgi:hypothetical protein
MNNNKRTTSSGSDTFPAMRPIVYQPAYEIGFSVEFYQRLQKEWGGYDAATKEVTPLHFSEGVNFQFYLDSLAGAVESGLISASRWPQQLFADAGELDAFLDALEVFDERLSDRQFRTICVLGGNAWPCTTNADAAIAVRASAARLSKAALWRDSLGRSDGVFIFDWKLPTH